MMEFLREKEESSEEVRFKLRDIVRQKVNQKRKELRDAVLVGRRHIEGCYVDVEKLTASDIEALALRLKKKQGGREGCYKDLNSLQTALSFSGEKYGKAFMKVDGAVAALVRHVSGHNSSLQLRATYCCANLSLAGCDVGFRVAKAVAPYLINHLQGMNYILVEASLWAVGSLAGSGMPAFKVLEVQGIYPQLIAVMKRYHPISSVSQSQEKHKVKMRENRVMEAALYAAAHCVSTELQNGSESSDIEALVAASIPLLNKVDPYTLSRLVYLFFVLSCSETADNIFLNKDFFTKILLLLDEALIVVIDGQNDFNSQGLFVQVITFIIRTLGNLCSSENGRLLIESMTAIACPVIIHLMNTVTHLPSHVKRETSWFMMQLLKPYIQWNGQELNLGDCPWGSLSSILTICFEQQKNFIVRCDPTIENASFIN